MIISTERIQPNLVTVADMDAADAIDLIHEAQAIKLESKRFSLHRHTRLTSSLKTQPEQRLVSKWHK